MKNILSTLSVRTAKSVEWVLLVTTFVYTAVLGASYLDNGEFDTLTEGFFGTLQLILLVLWMVDVYALLKPKWRFSKQIRLISLAGMILASLFYTIMQIISPMTDDPLWIYSLGMAAISFIIHLSVKFDVS